MASSLHLPPPLHRAGGKSGGVQLTNDDAQVSKLSCVRLGYFKDDFVQHFVRRPHRRSPLINRGYYSRYAAIRDLLLHFLVAGAAEGHPLAGAKQVLSLGAGYDTTFFQLASEGLAPRKYVEVDVLEVTQQKAAVIARTPQLARCLGVAGSGRSSGGGGAAAEAAAGAAPAAGLTAAGAAMTLHEAAAPPPAETAPPAAVATALPAVRPAVAAAAGTSQAPASTAAAASQAAAVAAAAPAAAAAAIDPGDGRVLTDRYALLPADLRQLGSLQAALEQAGLDPALPTFVLSECVLVYMEPQQSAEASRAGLCMGFGVELEELARVVRWLGQHLQTAAFVVYEQIQPDDAFGRQMLMNLELRGCPLLGISATPSLEAQAARFSSAGWERAEAESMDTVYRDCLDPEDRRRAERLELFDELEEWHLIQQHYCIAIGVKDATGNLLAGYGLPRRGSGGGGGGRAAEAAERPPAGEMPPPPPRLGLSRTERQQQAW